MYRCTNEKCSGKSANPRHRLPVVAYANGSYVDMVFFGDTTRDLIGKDANILLAENYALVSTIPSEIGALAGKCYVVEVTVSWYTFRTMDIFQVLKFYPEGCTVLVAHDGELVGAGKAVATLPISAADTAESVSASRSGDRNDQIAIPVPGDNTPLSVLPPVPTEGTPREKPSGQDGEGESELVDGALPKVSQQIKNGENITKRQLFNQSSGKSAKKFLFIPCAIC